MRVQDADLKSLRIFETVVKCGGFSAAQPALNISVSAISEQMSLLETRLGVRLCERGRSGFRLTDEGQVLYEAAQRMLTAVETFSMEAATLRRQLSGALRVGVIDATLTDPSSPLTLAIRRFGQMAPQVHLQIHIDTPNALEQRVMDGRLHLAVGPFPSRLPGLDYTPLYTEAHGLFCSRTDPLFEQDDASITPLLLSQARLAARTFLGRFDLDQLQVERAAGSVDNVEARAMMIISGQYIGFLPLHYAQPWVDKGEIRRLCPGQFASDLCVDVILRHGVSPPRTVEAFQQQLLECAGLNPSGAMLRELPKSTS
ncbi:LysR family transcriptional regulator [Pseudomonas guariconensis]|uniref:LysR family transcriptional regulator n=1 Tax=Pseudomonas guariconensis TaxID=1288410 RepID=UPI0018AB85E2|nr:LysR family transcriptional regulator [Pseudomonas guariconensis]MBF8753894.1 LysR family transcriptional regulator [Pseudomonas guariconensis]